MKFNLSSPNFVRGVIFIVVELVIGRLTEDVDPPAAPFRRPNTALPSDKEDDDVSTPTPE